MSETAGEEGQMTARATATRRGLLRLGAAAVPAVVTLRPAFAAQQSILACDVPVTDWVNKRGKVVAPGSKDGFAPPIRPYTGEEIRRGVRPAIHQTDGAYLDDSSWDAHLAYIRNLQQGRPGYTCLVSIRAGAFR